MLQTLNPLEPRYRVEQLHSNRTENRSQVQEEEVAATTRRLYRILDELHYSLRFEHRAAAETEITWKESLLEKFVLIVV